MGKALGAIGWNKVKEALDSYLHESVVPGPYGQPMSEWGPEGPTGWGDPTKYTDEAGGAWKFWEDVALEVATTAALAAAGGIGAEAAGWQSKASYHGAHHAFGEAGKLSHIQVNIWKEGVKGSGKSFRFPLPW